MPSAVEEPGNLEETYAEIAENLVEFSEEAGFDDYHHKVAHVLLLGIHLKADELTVDRLCELVGCDLRFAQTMLGRIDTSKIYNRLSWFDEEVGDMSFMLDVMTVAGILERRETEDGELEYHRNENISVGDFVKHKSGFGSGWWISAQTIKDGKRKVRLKKSRVSTGPGGKWRDIENYKRHEHL